MSAEGAKHGPGQAPERGDVHVMPNDGAHEASSACWCKPTQDEQTKRAIAQGVDSGRVWIHNQAN